MLIYPESRLTLGEGHTYAEYILRCNATKTPISELCTFLKLSFFEAIAIYDKVYNIPLSHIGEAKRSAGIMVAEPIVSKLEYLKTGTDWRAK